MSREPIRLRQLAWFGTVASVMQCVLCAQQVVFAQHDAVTQHTVEVPVQTIQLRDNDQQIARLKYAEVTDSQLREPADDPSVRLTLVLPQGSVALELRVTIAGRPFRQLRAARVQRLLAGDTSDPLAEKYQHYVTVTQREVTFDEARWLLRRWGEDASLAILSDQFERSRANQSPVRDCLDRDGDGELDASEIASAIESLRRCDTNSDDIVSDLELQRAANSLVHNKIVWSPEKLLIRHESSIAETATSLADASSADVTPEGVTPADKSSADRGDVPTVTMVVDFAQPTGTCRVSSLEKIDLHGGSARLELAGATVELTVLQAAGSEASDQVSLGVVNDGYPIAPLVDANHDGRLTIRELRAVPEALESLDRNHDQRISAAELAPTIRVAVGHGLCVHEFLSNVRIGDARAAEQERLVGPDWFNSLDKNHDNDLSRSEFVGTPEQFEKLDIDHDELISVNEANQAP